MRNLLVFIIGALLFTMIGTPILINVGTCNSSFDSIDQKQELTPQIQWLDGEDWQQFEHGGGTLTKVDVHIGQYFSGSHPITLSIEAIIGTTPMTLETLGPMSIPSNSEDWVTFDVIDVELNAGQKYYIVLRFNPGSEYTWSGAAGDPYPLGVSSVGLNWDYAFRTYTIDTNSPPNKPDKPTGQTNGNTGTSYSYQTSTTDPDGDQVWYKWDWGDEISEWDGPYTSGDIVSKSYNWTNQGTYPIKVKAKDSKDVESVWSEPLSVTMPKAKIGKTFDLIGVLGFDVDVKIVQLEPGEDYVDLEVLNRPLYIFENSLITINPGAFIRLYTAKGLFSPSLSICFGICNDWGIIG